MSTSSIKRQIKRFHVARAVEVKKIVLKSVMHVQSCCFDHELIVFWSCRRRWSCLSSLTDTKVDNVNVMKKYLVK